MNKKMIICNELKKRNIPTEVKLSILPLIEKNIERVQFVKSFVGLKDILYFEELGVEFFDFPFFLSLNCQSISTLANKYESISSVYENAITDFEDIQRKLLFLFEETNRTLFIEIAFSENALSNDDMWKVYYQMNEEKNKEPFELMVKMYRYPEWYDVDYGENIALFEESLSLLKQIENYYIGHEIKKVENQINIALENNELDVLPKLVQTLKILQNQFGL